MEDIQLNVLTFNYSKIHYIKKVSYNGEFVNVDAAKDEAKKYGNTVERDGFLVSHGMLPCKEINFHDEDR